MLFNSFQFLLIFLPIALVGWHLASRHLSRQIALHWLLVCSLVFYSCWHAPHVLLLGTVVMANYFLCRGIASARGPARKWWLGSAVTANLLVLGWYKYAGFILENLPLPRWVEMFHVPAALPLGVSFFTFQLVAFAVDVYRGFPAERRPGIFALVVSFFPHLIAGPILHPRKFLAQFDQHPMQGLRSAELSLGLTWFVIGLFKKVGIADGVGQWVGGVFDAVPGTSLTFLDAWTAALAYTFQLYFDFSGYSDMAIGLGWMFGLRIPFNFDSPYKATSIVDFWRRWHMTLSQLLRDYVYIPLGGNRLGPTRRYTNLMLTMLIGGFWHGAGWSFIVWGGLHGTALVVAHLWGFRRSEGAGGESSAPSWWQREAGWLATFFFIIATWVVFRSDSLTRAGEMLKAMTGLNGVELPQSYVGFLHRLGLGWLPVSAHTDSPWLIFRGISQWLSLAALLVVVKYLPNSQELMRQAAPTGQAWTQRLFWRPSLAWSLLISAGLAISLLRMVKSSEFLYFQF
jgi:alginate O-acetyltransferase complex protein AlgI